MSAEIALQDSADAAGLADLKQRAAILLTRGDLEETRSLVDKALADDPTVQLKAPKQGRRLPQVHDPLALRHGAVARQVERHLVGDQLLGLDMSRPHMLDQSHNVTDPIESLMTSAIEVQRAYAQALLVDGGVSIART